MFFFVQNVSKASEQEEEGDDDVDAERAADPFFQISDDEEVRCSEY